jgi:hypothetical protein
VNAAAAPDATGATYSAENTDAAQTHRRGSERITARPRTRAEYIDHVLAQIKASGK